MVTATNAGGSTTTQSSPTAAVTPLPPTNTVRPSIVAIGEPADALSAIGIEAIEVDSAKSAAVSAADAGASTTQPGDTLSTTNGIWSNSPTGYSYQWQDCASSCTSITGATGSSYTLRNLRHRPHDPRGRHRHQRRRLDRRAVDPTAGVDCARHRSTPACRRSAGPRKGRHVVRVARILVGSPTAYSYQWQDCNPAAAPTSPARPAQATRSKPPTSATRSA